MIRRADKQRLMGSRLAKTRCDNNLKSVQFLLPYAVAHAIPAGEMLTQPRFQTDYGASCRLSVSARLRITARFPSSRRLRFRY